MLRALAALTQFEAQSRCHAAHAHQLLRHASPATLLHARLPACLQVMNTVYAMDTYPFVLPTLTPCNGAVCPNPVTQRG